MQDKLINILIRHKEGRGKQLAHCLETCSSQSYRNYQLFISIEIDKRIPCVNNVLVPQQHYNLHCNNLKAEVEDGWFFYLDDDDYLASPTVLEELSHHLFEGALIVQFERKNNNGTKRNIVKPTATMMMNKQIRKGMIGGGCLVLHHSFKDVADWLPQASADYDYIKEVIDKVPTRFVPLVLQVAENKNNGK